MGKMSWIPEDINDPPKPPDCRECGYWTAQGQQWCHRCGKDIVREEVEDARLDD